MATLIDLTGRRFGRWTVLSRAPSKPMHAKWMCRCDCGKVRPVDGSNLREGVSASCGCAHGKHLHARTKAQTSEYLCWRNMRQRCENPRWPSYKNYGGRGIKVCDRWQSFENFLADMGAKPSPELTIERMDNSKGYDPENCEWETTTHQIHNRRSRAQVREDDRNQIMERPYGSN